MAGKYDNRILAKVGLKLFLYAIDIYMCLLLNVQISFGQNVVINGNIVNQMLVAMELELMALGLLV